MCSSDLGVIRCTDHLKMKEGRTGRPQTDPISSFIQCPFHRLPNKTILTLKLCLFACFSNSIFGFSRKGLFSFQLLPDLIMGNRCPGINVDDSSFRYNHSDLI